LIPFTALSLVAGSLVLGCLGGSSSLALGFIYLVFMRSGRARLDLNHVMAILHMYSISTGEAGPEELVGVVAKTTVYGSISKIFGRIILLAQRFGYGFSRAAALVAESVKAPLRDFLMRCTEMFSSRNPKDYLEIEVSTAMEEYAGMYSRSLGNLRVMGGTFSTFQSAVIFIIMTLSILTVFLADSGPVYLAYGVSFLSLVILFLGLRSITPKEDFFHRADEPPRTYRSFLVALSTTPFFAIVSVGVYMVRGPALAFVLLGLGFLFPGFFGYRLERFVKKVEAHYPAFIKALSESLISVSDLKAAFSYLLYMELGPLETMVRRALNRLRLRVSAEKTMDLLSSETGSRTIFLTNRIFLDAFKQGGDLAEVGKKLSSSIIRIQELRKERESVSRSFETMVLVTQPIAVILLVLMGGILVFFGSSLVNLPYFSFGEIPMSLVNMGSVGLVLFLSFLNALSIKEIRGGFWGAALLYAGVLLILSGVVWLVTDRFTSTFFKEAFTSVGNLPF